MQKSFSIVEDGEPGEAFDDGVILAKYERGRSGRRSADFGKGQVAGQGPDLEELAQNLSKIPSAGPSGRPSVMRSRSSSKNRTSSGSDSDDEKAKNLVLGEYEPKLYENLDVGPEIKDIFQYITKYIPQQMSLDHKFRPFVPEFLPAVGDIDAFLKVVPPAGLLPGEPVNLELQLGLAVLDEPAANQSDSALLHLQLRAESTSTAHHDGDVVAKKLDNVEKSAKVVDKWIKDVSALHKSKSFPSVRYAQPMPDLDELMQEWPEAMERRLKLRGFPGPEGTLDEYIEEVCGVFGIPTNSKIQALHLVFSLYAAVKSSVLFKRTQLEKEQSKEELDESVPDQLLLE